MQTVKIHKLSIFSEDRYDYKRTSTVSLSEEHFEPDDVKQILAQLISLCVFNEVKFESNTDTVEIPVDEDESLANKLKEATKQNSAHWTERSKKDTEIKELKLQIETLKSVCPTDHLPEDEDPENAPNQGTTDTF